MSSIASRSNTRLVAGALVAAVLVVALVLSLIGEDADDPVPSGAPSSASRGSSPPTTAVTLATPDSNSSLVSKFLPGDVQLAGEAVLVAWGRFVGSGDISALNGRLHPLSPQRPLLAERAKEIPPEGPPCAFVMSDPLIEPLAPGFAAMQGLVTPTCADRALAESEWRLVFAWSREADSWLVWTLEELG